MTEAAEEPAPPTIGVDLGATNVRGAVVDRGGSVTVPFGKVKNVLTSLEATRLERGAYDQKVYGPGIGIVLEQSLSGDTEVAKLVSVSRP